MQRIIFWAVMVGLLAYMLFLAFQDATQTGEDPNVVGAVAAWVAVTALALATIKLRVWLSQKLSRAIDALANRLDD